jgi:hypothetical protein
MARESSPFDKDPAEGSRETIDRQLEQAHLRKKKDEHSDEIKPSEGKTDRLND